MSDTPISIPPILRLAKDAFKGDLGKRSVYLGDAAIAMSLATIARGNWQPMEKTRAPVRKHLQELPGMDTAENQKTKSEATGRDLVSKLTSCEEVFPFLDEHKQDTVERDVIVANLEGLVGAMTQSVVELYLNFQSTPTASFSETLRLRCVQFCGEWHAYLLTVFKSEEDPDTFTKLCIDTLQGAASGAVRRDQMLVETACAILFQFYQNFKSEYANSKA